ncbi:MAG: WD40/YVTN/BNR-like repeat-containing protein [Steroidobacteraceae bacterium]
MLTCLSPNGAQLTSADTPIDQVMVATVQGLHTLQRGAPGAPWRVVASVLEDRQISALLLEPRSGRLYAGTHGNAGLWVSEDGGKQWRELTNGLTSKHIYTINVQYRDDRTVLWVGTEPPMLFRSDDLGESFVELPAVHNVPDTDKWCFPPPPHVSHVKHIAFHPKQPKTLYVCIEQGALLKSTDDGQSWIELHGYEQPDMDIKFRHDTHRVAIKPSDPETLYLVAGEGVYVSHTAGEDWQQLQSRFDRIGYPDALFLDPRNERVVFVGGAGVAPEDWGETRNARAGVIRSTDGGLSWSEGRAGLPDPVRGNIEAMAHHHAGTYLGLLAGTALGEVFLSEDDGKSWTCIAAELPPISKAGHYRWFLSEEERAAIVNKMWGWKDQVRA